MDSGSPITTFEGRQVRNDKALEHISESCGVRKTSRLAGVHRDTVTWYSLAAGEHAKVLHDELVAIAVSNTINTAFVERYNGTDRNRNARKVRKSYCFSKDWDVHNAMTYFTMYSYNFCWPVRTLRVQDQNGSIRFH